MDASQPLSILPHDLRPVFPLSPVISSMYCDDGYYSNSPTLVETALKGQSSVLPSVIEASRLSWMTSAQTSALINGLLAAVEVAFLQIVKQNETGQTGADTDATSTALRFFVYVGLILSLGGAMSSLIMIDILGEVPVRFMRRPPRTTNHELTLDSLLDGRWTVAKMNRDLSRFVVMLCFLAQLILFIISRETPKLFIPATIIVSLIILPLVVMYPRSPAS